MRELTKTCVLCAGLFVLHGSALAALGEPLAPLGENEASTAAEKRLLNTPPLAADSSQDSPQDSLRETQLDSGILVREYRLDSGILVKEYASAEKIVFAVTWQGPFLPDLRQLLGKYFGDYTEAAAAARSNPDFSLRGPLRIDSPRLVVQSAGRLRAFSGRAYLPEAIPENFSIDMIQ